MISAFITFIAALVTYLLSGSAAAAGQVLFICLVIDVFALGPKSALRIYTSFIIGTLIAAAIGAFAVLGRPVRGLINGYRFIARKVARLYHWVCAPYVVILRLTNHK